MFFIQKEWSKDTQKQQVTCKSTRFTQCPSRLGNYSDILFGSDKITADGIEILLHTFMKSSITSAETP